MNTGEKIKAAREAAGLTQEKLAEKAMTTRGYLAKIEIGYKAPSVQLLKQISRALGCTMDELAG